MGTQREIADGADPYAERQPDRSGECPQSRRAALADRSWGQQFHFFAADGQTRSACGISDLLIEQSFDCAEVPEELRCQRVGCKSRWTSELVLGQDAPSSSAAVPPKPRAYSAAFERSGYAYALGLRLSAQPTEIRLSIERLRARCKDQELLASKHADQVLDVAAVLSFSRDGCWLEAASRMHDLPDELKGLLRGLFPKLSTTREGT